MEENGFLLIFEVISLLHGEQPYGDTGYILYGEEQFGILFQSDTIKSINISENDKSNMFVISKEILKNITKETILESLLSLKSYLYTKLKDEYQLVDIFSEEKIDCKKDCQERCHRCSGRRTLGGTLWVS